VTIIAFLQEGSGQNPEIYSATPILEAIPTAIRQSSKIRDFAYFCSPELLKQFVYLPTELRLVRTLESRIQNRFCESRL